MRSRQVLLKLLVVSVIALVATVGSKRAAANEKMESETGTKFNIIESTPMSEDEVANQPQSQSQSEPGAEEYVTGKTGKQTPGSDLSGRPVGWTVYVDPTYGFRIGYPKRFVVRPQNVAALAELTPTPVTSIFFMNPTMAAGALAGIEPPDLEVRVYQAGAVDSLMSWLVSAGFASASSGTIVQPYHTISVSGLEVCQSTLISPGCSVYVLRSGLVYQLTPISRMGETMIETFTPIP